MCYSNIRFTKISQQENIFREPITRGGSSKILQLFKKEDHSPSFARSIKFSQATAQEKAERMSYLRFWLKVIVHCITFIKHRKVSGDKISALFGQEEKLLYDLMYQLDSR